MKKLMGILMLGAMIFVLGGCAVGGRASVETGNGEVSKTVTAGTENSDSAENSSGEKVLIVYFSPANSDTADAISSATPRVGDASSVEYVAGLINSRVGGDVAKIIPKESYSTDYEETADRAKKERDDNVKPEFTLDVNPEEYDTIFVGYPIWWYQLPMVMHTFFDTYDFSQKKVIPFNTHAGSRDGGTYEDIRGLEPEATVTEGFAVSGENAGDADVDNWLTGY